MLKKIIYNFSFGLMAMDQQDLVMFNVAAVELLWPKNEHSSMILSKKRGRICTLWLQSFFCKMG